MTSFMGQWQAHKELFTVLTVAGAIFGFMQCCFGYRTWRFVLAANGIVGGLIAGLVVSAATGASNSAAVLGIQLLCAAITAFLMAGIKPLGTLLVGAGFGARSVAMVVDALGATGRLDQKAQIAVLALSGLVAGISFAASGKNGIIVLSSLNGGGWFRIWTGPDQPGTRANSYARNRISPARVYDCHCDRGAGDPVQEQ